MSNVQMQFPPFTPSAYGPVAAEPGTGREDDAYLRLCTRADMSLPAAKWLLSEAMQGDDYIGYAGLEFAPTEFDPVLTHYAPAFRLYIAPKFRFRGLGSKVAQLFISQLRTAGFSRPLLASHAAGDEVAEHILLKCGFLYTGCKTVGPGDQARLQMVAIF